MKRAFVAGMALTVLTLGARDARAQGAMVRGAVVDEQGQPLAGVKIEMQYMGKERQTFSRTTNEKGSFVQVGLPSGAYQLKYTKEGYQPLLTRTSITAGGLTEVPTETLKAAATKAAPASAAPGEAAPDVAKELQEAYGKAMEAVAAGRLDEAEALFKQVLEKAPDLAAAHYNLGHIHTRKKDWPAAEAEFKRAIELQPDRSDAYTALAVVYQETDRRPQAIELMSGANSKFERDATFQYASGIAYLNAGENALAQAAFVKARDLDPSRVEVHYYLATLAVGAGKVDEAVAHLTTYLSLTGQNPQNLETARRLLEAIKKPAKS
jgi:tetratricopeptide (TPR) repeat protein